MSEPRGRLTPLQAEILEAFFGLEGRFFLTGGGALAGFHLRHRETHDLDLFALSPVLDDGVRALRAVAEALRASWQELQTAPDLRRRLLSRGDDSVVVDLVLVRAPQTRPEKLQFVPSRAERAVSRSISAHRRQRVLAWNWP